MTQEQTQAQEQVQDQTQEQPMMLGLSLTVDQVQMVLNSLGKLPTEANVWPLRQYIMNQAQQQISILNQQTAGAAEGSESAAE